ncbi:ATP-binding cassette domain-containing protein [uncultured Muribaculum sp.]|uniref:ATP-binding cassette domain-containing protein n=1 Tax=uncultured Muribaculum sp. TaxID=1918613 RepID=UPI0033B227B5
MPKSYDTILSHSNMCLSKGQIQRILIARAIYKDADIYLFDEIINCLGEQMGNDIIEKIDLFLKEKTRIYTTHRHQILKNSDYIYYLQDGYVADLGTYEELHKRSRL